ncbi:MAG: DUF47 family protein [Anaerolineaceae bacterium]|nr:DUF47 family protein [Anaerolineaceae bacterium]
MFGKNKRDAYYFDSFVSQCTFSCELSKRTAELLRNFKYEEVKDNLIELHGIEHAADQVQHDIMEHLIKEFIAPLEREDIVLMARELDDLTDCIEDIMITCYEYDLRQVDDVMLKYMDLIEVSVNLLLDLLKKFENFKKDATLGQAIIEINRHEEEGDRIYREAMHTLFVNESDPKVLMAKKEVYACLETVMDDIEDLANTVESVIMKNT